MGKFTAEQLEILYRIRDTTLSFNYVGERSIKDFVYNSSPMNMEFDGNLMDLLGVNKFNYLRKSEFIDLIQLYIERIENE